MADKTKTIKTASDKELNELIARLEKESRAQSLIAEIKRKSANGYVQWEEQLGISTEAPIDSLYHFGILGMRWGHRKARSGSEVSTGRKGKSDEPDSDDHKKKLALKGKKISKMTNAELKALNERLQLEKQYKELSKQDVSAGKKFVMDLVRDLAKETIKDVAKGFITGKGSPTYSKLFKTGASAIKTATQKKKEPIGFRMG